MGTSPSGGRARGAAIPAALSTFARPRMSRTPTVPAEQTALARRLMPDRSDWTQDPAGPRDARLAPDRSSDAAVAPLAFRITVMPSRLSRLLRPAGIEESIGLFVLAVALLLALASAVFAHDYAAGGLRIEHPWARATPAGAKVAGGYLVVRNTGAAADRLLGGEAPFAGGVELHEMKVENGVMTMRPLADGVDVPAGGTVTFAPGGYHVMFVDLKAGLVAGERHAGALLFEKAGRVEVEWAVEALGARAPAAAEGHGDHGAHDHGHGG